MTLTVAGALVELKLLEKRIEKAYQNGVFVSYLNGKDLPTGYKSHDEIENKIKSSIQSAQDLIKRRNVIKSAIVVSNATTSVAVADVKMTVAEAIERKSSITFEKNLLAHLKHQLVLATRQVDTVNNDVSVRADKMTESYLGNDKSKASEAEQFRKGFVESNSAKLIDPIDIKIRIEQLEESIDKFEAEVDLVLSTSNAITQLDIE